MATGGPLRRYVRPYSPPKEAALPGGKPGASVAGALIADSSLVRRMPASRQAVLRLDSQSRKENLEKKMKQLLRAHVEVVGLLVFTLFMAVAHLSAQNLNGFAYVSTAAGNQILKID